MHGKHKSGTVIGILLPVGLICLFAFCSLALALLGGMAYKNIQKNVDDSYGSTVAASYLHTKLSQNNLEDAVAVRDVDGTQVLAIATTIGEKKYEIRIFMDDGWLVETFGAASQPLDAIGASRIAQLESCEFAVSENGLFTAVLVNQSGEHTKTAFAITQGGSL